MAGNLTVTEKHVDSAPSVCVCMVGGEHKQVRCLVRERKVERDPPCPSHLLSPTLKALCDLAQPTCPSANSIDLFIHSASFD